MSDLFCYACGAPTVAIGGRLVPICAECRSRGEGEGAVETAWMIAETAGSRMKGPMSRKAVLTGIARGRYGPDSKVSAIGGEAKAVADHPDFRGCFIPGSADELTIEVLREEWEATARRAKWRRILSYTLGGLLLVGAAGALWYSSQTRIFVLPEEAVENVEAQVERIQATVEAPVRYLDVPSLDSVPHRDWVSAQRLDANPGTAFARARAKLWEASGRELNDVRRLYLSAIKAAPLDPEPLAGLVLVNASMVYTRPALLGEVSRAMSRLDILGATGPGPDSARAALALSRGNRLEATRLTESCASIDAMCGMMHGFATLDTAAVEAAAGELSDTRFARGILAETALVARDWTTLAPTLDAILLDDPSDLRAWELRAEFAAALGRWGEALGAADKAIALGTERAETLHLSAAIHLENGEHPLTVVPRYRELVSHPHLSGHTNREVALVQAAWVHVRAGDLDEAREVIDAALEAHPASVSARVILSDILYKDGDHAASEGILQGIEIGDLDGAQAARVHLWAGRLYLDMGKLRLAKGELDEAKRIHPRSPRVGEELAWASLMAENTGAAIRAVRDMVPVRPFDEFVTDPRAGTGLRAPDRRRLMGPLLRAIDEDVRFNAERDSIEAILSWWGGEPGDIAALRTVAEGRPGDLEVQIALALGAFSDGDWQTALDAATAVVGRKPSLSIMHSIRGRSLSKLGRWMEAKDPLNRSVKSDTEQASLLTWAAEEYALNGEPDEAERLLEAAGKLAPWDPRIRDRRFALVQQKK